MNFGTIISLVLKLLPLIPQLKELMSNPAIAEIIKIITSFAGEIFPGGAKPKTPDDVLTRVKAIQQTVNDLGQTPPLLVDGIYGEATKAAVKAFQEKNGLEADGWFGQKTDAKAKEVLKKK